MTTHEIANVPHPLSLSSSSSTSSPTLVADTFPTHHKASMVFQDMPMTITKLQASPMSPRGFIEPHHSHMPRRASTKSRTTSMLKTKSESNTTPNQIRSYHKSRDADREVGTDAVLQSLPTPVLPPANAKEPQFSLSKPDSSNLLPAPRPSSLTIPPSSELQGLGFTTPSRFGAAKASSITSPSISAFLRMNAEGRESLTAGSTQKGLGANLPRRHSRARERTNACGVGKERSGGLSGGSGQGQAAGSPARGAGAPFGSGSSAGSGADKDEGDTRDNEGRQPGSGTEMDIDATPSIIEGYYLQEVRLGSRIEVGFLRSSIPHGAENGDIAVIEDFWMPAINVSKYKDNEDWIHMSLYSAHRLETPSIEDEESLRNDSRRSVILRVVGGLQGVQDDTSLSLPLPPKLPIYRDGKTVLTNSQIKEGCEFIEKHIHGESSKNGKGKQRERDIRVQILAPRARPEDALTLAVCFLAYSSSSPFASDLNPLSALDASIKVAPESESPPYFDSSSFQQPISTKAHAFLVKWIDEETNVDASARLALGEDTDERRKRGRSDSMRDSDVLLLAREDASVKTMKVDVGFDIENERGIAIPSDWGKRNEIFRGKIHPEWLGVLSFDGVGRLDEAARELGFAVV